MNTFNVWAALLFSVLAHPLASADSAVSSIYNYYALPENLGSSGQPSAEQFAAIRAEDFDVVINLAMPDSENAIADEGRMVSENGMIADDASTPLLTAWLPQMDENWRSIYDLTATEIAP